MFEIKNPPGISWDKRLLLIVSHYLNRITIDNKFFCEFDCYRFPSISIGDSYRLYRYISDIDFYRLTTPAEKCPLSVLTSVRFEQSNVRGNKSEIYVGTDTTVRNKRVSCHKTGSTVNRSGDYQSPQANRALTLPKIRPESPSPALLPHSVTDEPPQYHMGKGTDHDKKRN